MVPFISKEKKIHMQRKYIFVSRFRR